MTEKKKELQKKFFKILDKANEDFENKAASIQEVDTYEYRRAYDDYCIHLFEKMDELFGEYYENTRHRVPKSAYK
jgi:hypothetical protein